MRWSSKYIFSPASLQIVWLHPRQVMILHIISQQPEEATMTQLKFQTRQTVEQVEEGTELAPKFDKDGLMPCITADERTVRCRLPLIAQRTVLRLAFAEQITFARNEGLRTPKTTLPFKVLEGFSCQKKCGASRTFDSFGVQT
ncbi:MAG: hypothetical protein ACRBBS_00710 [Thalassovita sp.]